MGEPNLNESSNRCYLIIYLMIVPRTLKVSTKSRRKWYSSDATKDLVEQHAREWDKMTSTQRKDANKDTSISARNDYRQYVEGVLGDIETANAVGNVTEVFKCAKQLSSRGTGNRFIQSTLDGNGDPITTTEQ